MAASRRLYTNMAQRLRQQEPEQDVPQWPLWVDMVYQVANAFTDESASFNRERFLTACGLDAEYVAKVEAMR